MCLWTRRFTIVHMSVPPNWHTQFNAILIKMPARLFMDTDKIILEYILKGKITKTAKLFWKEI